MLEHTFPDKTLDEEIFINRQLCKEVIADYEICVLSSACIVAMCIHSLGHFRKLPVIATVYYSYSGKPKLKRAEERLHIDLICADISQ